MAREDRFSLRILLVGGPISTFPIDEVSRGFFGHSLPPDIAVVGEGDIGEYGVAFDGIHRHRIAFAGGAGGNPEKTGLGINGSEPAIWPGLDPGNIVAHAGDLPPLFFEMLGRDDHGKVCFAAGAREGCGDVGLFPLGILDTKDEHVLSHPSLVASHGGGDTEGETFFAEQGIPAVA